MCVEGEKRGCVIIVIISWLWLSGRLAALRTHLLNETWRCWRAAGRREGGGETERGRKWWKPGKRKEGSRGEIYGGSESALVPWCLMKCWANEVLVVYIITGSSSHSSLSALPSPTCHSRDSQSGCGVATPAEQVTNPIFTQKLLSASAGRIPAFLSHREFKWDLLFGTATSGHLVRQLERSSRDKAAEHATPPILWLQTDKPLQAAVDSIFSPQISRKKCCSLIYAINGS